ncbi:sugar isomerase, partial [Escherichia coli]|nr:sugar isomerase [Escherichia coli]
MAKELPLSVDQIESHNAARVEALRDEYDSLGRALARRGIDIEAVKARVAGFSVAV